MKIGKWKNFNVRSNLLLSQNNDTHFPTALWFTHDISKAEDMFLLQRKIEQAKDKTKVNVTKDEL